MIFQSANRQTGIIRIRGYERTPPCDPHFERKVFIMQLYFSERKASQEFRFTKSGKTKGRSFGPSTRAALAEFFSAGHRSFKYSGTARLAFKRYGGEYGRLVEDLGIVSYRYMRDRACTFQAEHAGP